MATSKSPGATVFVVDDDAAVRSAVGALLNSVNMQHELFASADEFLARYRPDRRGCLVLDIRMPGLGGLELQQRLNARDSHLPIIFVTGYADVPMAVEAMQEGAFDFIEKPYRDQDLLGCIARALATDQRRRIEREESRAIAERAERLTPREREVLDYVVTGKPNKIIAFEMKLSQRTVEIHRSRVMEKMQAVSLAELVRMHMSLSS